MITYRKATRADISDLVRLRLEFLKDVGQKVARTDDEMLSALTEYFLRHLADDDCVFWFAEDNGAIVATGGISFYALAPNFRCPTGERAYILSMYTIPSHRRLGIAKQIFGKLMEEAAKKNIPQVSLHATEDGRPLYETFGFTPESKEMVWRGIVSPDGRS